MILTTGCELKQIDTPIKPKIDETLPVVSKESIKTIPDMTDVAFEWQKVDDPSIKGYYIYRADALGDNKLKRVAEIESKYTTHYVDEELEPSTQYLYAMSTIGKNGLESMATSPISAQTLPRLESVSYITAISNMPRQIKILWRPHENERIKYYQIQRKSPLETKWKKLKKVRGRLQVEYIDDGLKDNEIFSYRMVSVTFDGIESHPSQIVKAKTKPLPKGVENLTATKDMPKKIELNWEFSKTADVVAYNVYVSDTDSGSYSKIATIKSKHNGFAHLVNEDGKVQFYKITSVDKDSLETDKNFMPVMGSTLPKPKKPTVTLAQIQGEKAILNWVAGDDRTVGYNIYKTMHEGWGKSKKTKIRNIKELRYEDRDIARGIEYSYTIQAIDEYGLLSDETAETSLILPKLQEADN